LHIEAWLRAQCSVEVAEGLVSRPMLAAALRDRLRQSEWLVLFGLDHGQRPGDCLAVIETEKDTPIVVMHRTGHAAVLNAAGARRLGLGTGGRVVYEPRGLWSRILGTVEEPVRRRLLRRLRTTLLSQGVVSVVDATPYRRKDEDRIGWITDALRPVRVAVMGDPRDPVPGYRYLKVVDPRTLPGLFERDPRLRDAPLAVHAIEADEILSTLDACPAGELRVEHAAICPPAVAARLAERGATVCANPGFLIDRYPAFAGLRASGEAEFLHPVASLLAAGCRVVFGSDAPVSRPGVACSVAAAVDRGSSRLPMAGAAVPLTVALDIACGMRGRGSSAASRDTFVVLDDTAPAPGTPYTVVSTVIDGQPCWLSGPMGRHLPRRF
jgi:predicted amidohydrolase YtcJ